MNADIHQIANDSSRGRLLEVAGEIFAERGFTATTVKQITDRAKMNVASVNYHFGDKLGLYAEVLRTAMPHRHLAYLRSAAESQLAAARPNEAEAREQLIEFITVFMESKMNDGRPGWCGRLMAWEMADPTSVFPQVVEEIIKPNMQVLRGIISSILDLPDDHEQVRLSAHGVLGQCVQWIRSKPVLPYLWPEMTLTDEQMRRIVTHIAEFSIAGMHATAKSANLEVNER